MKGEGYRVRGEVCGKWTKANGRKMLMYIGSGEEIVTVARAHIRDHNTEITTIN
jgi:hypothetical protein